MLKDIIGRCLIRFFTFLLLIHMIVQVSALYKCAKTRDVYIFNSLCREFVIWRALLASSHNIQNPSRDPPSCCQSTCALQAQHHSSRISTRHPFWTLRSSHYHTILDGKVDMDLTFAFWCNSSCHHIGNLISRFSIKAPLWMLRPDIISVDSGDVLAEFDLKP